jgi:fermentation-respiration switch protein FrsA (DUF1100 family)
LVIFLRGFFAVAVAFYLLLILVGRLVSDQLMFQPQRPGYQDSSEIIKLVSTNGAKISAKYLPNPAADYIILFSHGNAEDIGDDGTMLEGIRALGFSVFAYDYQGYGTSTGKPSERHVYDDAQAAYDYVVNSLHVSPARIIIFGRSLGGGPATELASRHPVAGLVLESAFTSAFRVMTRVSILPFDKFNNLKKIKMVRCPVLVIHGARDSVINPLLGKQLYAAANDPKQFLWVEKAGHNDLPFVAGDQYAEALERFVELIRKYQQR